MPLSRERVFQGLTPHVHEQDAIEFVRQALPDKHPYRIWALFDLVDLSGHRYEIDLLVLGYDALYHVEIKCWPGRVAGDTVDWHITFPDGATTVRQSPYGLADRKTKVLASLLGRQLGPARPYIETLVFLAHPDVTVELDGPARTGVITRADFLRAVQFHQFPGAQERRRDPIGQPTARLVARAIDALGIRPSQGALRLGDRVLRELLEEGPGYQDCEAVHERIPERKSRVRSYLVPQATTAERRQQLLRAADREARLLTLLSDHPGILKVTDYITEGPTGGPCLVFEPFDGGVPLDAYLRRHPDLPFERRIEILEKIGEALAYCHGKRILHRGLHPGAVLVRDRADGKGLEVRLYNFQLAVQRDHSPGTTHISQLGPEPALVYRAPEVLVNPEIATEQSDLFALGAIAYFLLAGRPPGATLAERQALLQAGGGRLSVAAIRDNLAGSARTAADSGAPEDGYRSLDDVIGEATAQNYLDRPDNVIAWVHLLVEEATAPPVAPPSPVDPLEARQGDVLGDGIEVLKILGTGATARVLRVRHKGAELALKVGLSPEYDERLLAEARVLERLERDGEADCIITCKGTLTLAGRLGLLLEDAGDTLADLLAREGSQSLDYARRWGEDLLRALEALEAEGILHRDIKPQNLGVPSGAAKKRRHLFLFDFSLAGVDPTVVTACTPAYADPFVFNRGRWDHAADRFSAAITLYELLTGVRPRWGKGDVPALATDEEMTIEAERFDAGVRDRLLRFFRRAFARDLVARHLSAEAMRLDWNACFDLGRPASVPPPAPAEAAQAEPTPAAPASSPGPSPTPPAPSVRTALEDLACTPATPIAALPLSARAQNALDRSGVITVGDLLALPQNQLSAIRGVGRETAREIQHLLQRLRQICPPPPAPLEPPPPGPPTTVEAWIRIAFPEPRKRGQGHWKHVRQLFGVDPLPLPKGRSGSSSEFARDPNDVAARHGCTRQAVSAALQRARAEWAPTLAALEPDAGVPASWHLAPLRDLVLAALSPLADVASLAEAGAALLDQLPSENGAPADPDADLPTAVRLAAALVRVIAEATGEFTLRRVRRDGDLGVARSGDLIDLAAALGQGADDLARREPLPSTEQTRAELGAVVRETPLEPIPFERLLRLAAAASIGAAVSARLELYPRGMDWARALQLSAGALGRPELTEEELARIVHARYPEAAPLPPRPALDTLLGALQLLWDPDRGRFVRRIPGEGSSLQPTAAASPARRPRLVSVSPPRRTADPREQARHELRERVLLAAERRLFRVLEVPAVYADHMAEELRRLLDVKPLSLEREILRAVDEVVRDWEIPDPEVLIEADRQGPGGPDWENLRELVEEAAARVLARLGAQPGPLLLTQPGLLARYRLERFLSGLVEVTHRDDGPGVLLVVPAFSDPSPTPVIHAPGGGLPIPLTSPGQRLALPQAWEPPNEA